MQGLLLCAIVEQSDCKSSSCFCIERCRPSILWWRGCGASFAVTSRSRPRKDGQSLYLTGVHFTEYTSQGSHGRVSYRRASHMRRLSRWGATIVPRGCDVSPVFALRDKRSPIGRHRGSWKSPRGGKVFPHRGIWELQLLPSS
jgi:hypothetical protein